MFRMNRFGFVVLAAVMIMTAVGCSGEKGNPPSTVMPTSVATTAQAPLPDHTVRKIGDSPIPAPAGQFQCLKFGESDFRDFPAHTVVRPGQEFTKVWTLQNNCGVSTEGMRAVKIAGDVNGPTEFPLPNIAPGGSDKLSQEFTAPTDLDPGVYTALYRVLNEDDEHVSGLWVDVGVK